MARKLRIQYEGAIYHVINRGNYRRDVFGTVGAAQAFEQVVLEACAWHGWRLHAHVVLSNHYHLAVETPQAASIWGQAARCYRLAWHRYALTELALPMCNAVVIQA